VQHHLWAARQVLDDSFLFGAKRGAACSPERLILPSREQEGVAATLKGCQHLVSWHSLIPLPGPLLEGRALRKTLNTGEGKLRFKDSAPETQEELRFIKMRFIGLYHQ